VSVGIDSSSDIVKLNLRERATMFCCVQTHRRHLCVRKSFDATTTTLVCSFVFTSLWLHTTDSIISSRLMQLVTSSLTGTTVPNSSRCPSSTTCCRCCVASSALVRRSTAVRGIRALTASASAKRRLRRPETETCSLAVTAASDTAAPVTWLDIASLISDPQRRRPHRRRQQTEESPGSVLTAPR